MLFITVQQNNLDICIEYAINKLVVHPLAAAFTYLLFQICVCRYTNSGMFFFAKMERFENSIKKENFDFEGCIMVWTLLFSGM